MLIQMAGRPGSGKSTLARLLAPEIGAAVLDLDVVKTPLLDEGVAWDDAGRTAYSVMFSLADDMLANGRGVIIDSPCRWEFIAERGQQVAAERGVRYAMVECRLADRAEVARRLAGRPGTKAEPDHRPAPVGTGVGGDACRRGRVGSRHDPHVRAGRRVAGGGRWAAGGRLPGRGAGVPAVRARPARPHRVG
jgi:predicted kinase